MLKDGEYLEDLQRNNLKIIQSRGLYRFTEDAVFLAHFVELPDSNVHVVDFGTGACILPLLLSALYPKASFTGIEIQQELADMAERSVILNGLESRIKIIPGDFKKTEDFPGQGEADAVVANPPYLPLNAGKASAKESCVLAKQEVQCNLEDVFRSANRVLKGKGKLFMVYRPERLVDLCFFARTYDLEPKLMRFVIPSPEKDPSAVLVKCVKNANPGLRAASPLLVRDHENKLSSEAEEIYNLKGQPE